MNFSKMHIEEYPVKYWVDSIIPQYALELKTNCYIKKSEIEKNGDFHSAH